MSQNKSRIARTIRDSEGTQSCKQILKSSGCPRGNEIFGQLEQTNAQYEEKLAKLKKFTSKSKSAIKIQTHTLEWVEEQHRLQKLAFKIENTVRNTLETLLVTSPDVTDLHSIVQSLNDSSRIRKHNLNEITSQLHELKQMINEIKKSAERMNNSQTTSDNSIQSSGANSIVAQLLLSMHTSQSAVWTNLKQQEALLTADLSASSSRISALLRNDNISEQDVKLRLELRQLVGDTGLGRLLENHSTGENTTEPSEPDTANQQVDIELEMLVSEWLERIAALDREHAVAMSSKDAERSAFCEEIGVSCASRTGDWPEEEHLVFAKIVKKAQVTGMLRKVMVDLLVAQLPHQSLDSILLHEEWHRKTRLIAAKYRDGEALYLTARQDLMQQAKLAVVAHRDAQRERAIQEGSLALHEQHRNELHDRLSEMRARREVLNEEQREAQLAQEIRDRERLAAEKEALAAETFERKQQIQQYHAAQQALELQRREERLRAERAEEERRRAEIEENRPKVQLRAKLLAEKEQKALEREAEMAREEARRLELLERLAEQVPYFDAIQSATSKLDHVTASVRGHEYLKGDDLTRGHIPMNGFTDTRVVSDSRFRLAAALRSAGVQHSEAARMAVAKMCARPQLAIHGLL